MAYKHVFLIASAAVVFASSGLAGPIAVTNPSFETPGPGGLPHVCGVNCSYSTDGIVPGWSASANSGLFQPGPPATTAFFNSVPDGITVAYSNVGDITQTTAATVQLGVTYTLLVDVGVRGDNQPATGVEYLVIGGPAGTLVQATGVLGAPNCGCWTTFTATYTGLAADVGKSIGIDLRSNGVQGDWDNVRLNASAVAGIPEPASLSLIVAGLVGLAALGRRRPA
jgi:hypothetical protein